VTAAAALDNSLLPLVKEYGFGVVGFVCKVVEGRVSLQKTGDHFRQDAIALPSEASLFGDQLPPRGQAPFGQNQRGARSHHYIVS
jgi:hypothetical protein